MPIYADICVESHSNILPDIQGAVNPKIDGYFRLDI